MGKLDLFLETATAFILLPVTALGLAWAVAVPGTAIVVMTSEWLFGTPVRDFGHIFFGVYGLAFIGVAWAMLPVRATRR